MLYKELAGGGVMVLEQYQDIWVKGSLLKPGVRECASRWEIVKSVAERWKRPFTVLDIGANLGYFSLRIAEEFDCTVVAMEGVYSSWLEEILKWNNNPRVILLKGLFRLADFKLLSEIEHFDLVLALSVMHHIGEYKETLSTLRGLGDVLVAEIATEDNACGQEYVKQGKVPEDAKILGYGESHLSGPARPIFCTEQKRTTLSRSYFGTPLTDIDLKIESDYEKKIAIQRGRERPWYRGINLRTFLSSGGVYPSRDHIVELCKQARPKETHGDLKIHNTILQGDAVKYIDELDPRRFVENDEETFNAMIRELEDMK